MLTQLLQPQEIEVYYVIPTIRRYLAQFLKGQGMSQKAIAELFRIRESTVSQYITAKRASLISFPQQIVEEIKTSAGRIQTSLDMVRETQRTLKMVRETGTLCILHHQFSNTKLNCEPNDIGCLPFPRCP